MSNMHFSCVVILVCSLRISRFKFRFQEITLRLPNIRKNGQLKCRYVFGMPLTINEFPPQGINKVFLILISTACISTLPSCVPMSKSTCVSMHTCVGMSNFRLLTVWKLSV